MTGWHTERGGIRVDGGHMGKRHEPGFRQVQLLLVRMSINLFGELAFYKAKQGTQ